MLVVGRVVVSFCIIIHVINIDRYSRRLIYVPLKSCEEGRVRTIVRLAVGEGLRRRLRSLVVGGVAPQWSSSLAATAASHWCLTASGTGVALVCLAACSTARITLRRGAWTVTSIAVEYERLTSNYCNMCTCLGPALYNKRQGIIAICFTPRNCSLKYRIAG